jgi:hypothetical protein
METIGTIDSKIGFYIGDPCYILPDSIYRQFWGKQHKFVAGVFQNIPGYAIGGFAVAGTDCGDGCFEDNLGHHYPVDSGTLSVVSLELADEKKLKEMLKGEDSLILHCPGSAEFDGTDGYFYIKVNDTVVVIST